MQFVAKVLEHSSHSSYLLYSLYVYIFVLSDFIVCIKPDTVEVYCNPLNYDFILRYIAGWPDVKIHCLSYQEVSNIGNRSVLLNMLPASHRNKHHCPKIKLKSYTESADWIDLWKLSKYSLVNFTCYI